ncbi:MAG: alpha/beta hydrolase [Bacteroidales bacterium]|nr:alpha/beta hydrolase [Bacteroidales bacterium]
MRKLLIVLALVLGFGAMAQAQETYKYAQRDTCDLLLDIWRPDSGSATAIDSLAKPTVLYVFGGGFIIGRRDDPFTVKWFKRLNSEGYTVVSIDYRLGMKGYQVGKGLSGTLKASDRFFLSQQIGVEDVFSAVSFLASRPELGVSADNIVLAGSSAGAIISLASAYNVANGNTEGLPEGFPGFKGVMSFAGGIISNEGAPKFKQAPCPLLLFHGTADDAVAYKHLGAFGRGIWGSSYIADKLQKKGWPCCIYRFTDRTHAVAAYMDYLWPMEEEFLEHVTRGDAYSVDATIHDPSLPSWWNVSIDDIYKK